MKESILINASSTDQALVLLDRLSPLSEISLSAMLEIGGVCIEVRSDNRRLIEEIVDRYKAFASDKAPSVRLDVFVDEAMSVKDSHDLDVVLDEASVLFARNDFFGIIDYSQLYGKVVLSWSEELQVPISFDTYLRCSLIPVLLKEDKFLVHAASVIKDAKGHVFSGPSECGKTTISRLSTEYSILSDELVIIERDGDAFMVHGTPFWGELEGVGLKERAPIKAIFLPVKSAEISLERLDQIQACEMFLENVMFLDEIGIKRGLFELATSLCESVPFYRLHFLKDKSPWRYIDEHTQ